MKRSAINGFTSLTDMLTTAYKVKSWSINAFSFLSINVLSLAGFIYKPHQLIYLLFVLMLVDWGTGTYKAIRFRRFNSYKFQRMLWNLFFTGFLIGSSTQLGTHLWVFKALHLADVMLTGFLVTYLVSIIENLHEIDRRIIPDKFYFNLRRILDLDKILENYFRKDVSKEETALAVGEAVPRREVVPLLENAATQAGEIAEATQPREEAAPEPEAEEMPTT